MIELKVLRLREGQVLGDDDPVRAMRDASASAEAVLIVDLDAARSHTVRNRAVIASMIIVAEKPTFVMGRVADRGSAEALLAMNAIPVIHASALQEAGLVEFLAVAHPGRIALELNGLSATAVENMAVLGVEHFVEIENDFAKVLSDNEARSRSEML